MGAQQEEGGSGRSRPNGAAAVGAGRAGRSTTEIRTVNLALQGGGAHGAFAWGVLDPLLEDGRIGIEGISATSAGAMNATVLAYGLAEGGQRGRAHGARRLLAPHRAGGRRLAAAALAARPPDAQPRARLQPGLPDARPAGAGVLALPVQSHELQPAALHPRAVGRLRAPARQLRRSSCSSAPPTCARARCACSRTTRSRPTRCWPRPACRSCSRRWRSTARPTGTAATWAIPPSFR